MNIMNHECTDSYQNTLNPKPIVSRCLQEVSAKSYFPMLSSILCFLVRIYQSRLGHNLSQNATNIYMLGAFEYSEYYTTYQHMFAMSEKQFNFMRKRFEKCADVM